MTQCIQEILHNNVQFQEDRSSELQNYEVLRYDNIDNFVTVSCNAKNLKRTTLYSFIRLKGS